RDVARMIVRRVGMKRRGFLGLSVGGAIAALSPRAAAQTTIKEIRIGYQKTGVLVIARQQAVLEKRFAEKQVGIKWIEFTSGPAFANGSIEAWAIWDPYFAIGEKRQNGRILLNAHEVAKTNSFYLANRDFAITHVRETREVIDGLAEAARWAEANRAEVASALAAITGVPLEVQTVAANRASFLIGPVTDEIVTTQQAVADRFHRLGLIPKPITVRDIVW